MSQNNSISTPSKNFLRPNIEIFSGGSDYSPYTRSHRRVSKVDDIEVFVSTVRRTFKSPKSSENAENKKLKLINQKYEDQQYTKSEKSDKQSAKKSDKKSAKSDSGMMIHSGVNDELCSSSATIGGNESLGFSEQANVINLTNQFLKRRKRAMSIANGLGMSKGPGLVQKNSMPIMNTVEHPPKLILQNAIGL